MTRFARLNVESTAYERENCSRVSFSVFCSPRHAPPFLSPLFVYACLSRVSDDPSALTSRHAAVFVYYSMQYNIIIIMIFLPTVLCLQVTSLQVTSLGSLRRYRMIFQVNLHPIFNHVSCRAAHSLFIFSYFRVRFYTPSR